MRKVVVVPLSVFLIATSTLAKQSVEITTVHVRALICLYPQDSVNISDSYWYQLPATNEMIQKFNDEGRCISLTVQVDVSRLKQCETSYENCRGFSMQFNGAQYYVTLFPPILEFVHES